MKFVFIECQVESYQNILKLNCRTIALNSYKAFLKNKNKKGTGTSLPASFSKKCPKKNVYLKCIHQLTKFHYLVDFTS